MRLLKGDPPQEEDEETGYMDILYSLMEDPKAYANKLENKINKDLLGSVMYDAGEAAYNEKVDLGGKFDSYRHALASAMTVNRLKEQGYPAAVAWAMANGLGLAHELTAGSNTFRESSEDVFNNLVGSTIGTFKSPEESKEIAKYLASNYLPDGRPQGGIDAVDYDE